MKRGRWAQSPEILHAYSELGVIRAKTLVTLGVKESTIYKRCLPGGRWRRLLPGIILLQNSPPNEQQRIAAAVLYTGTESQVTGLAACRLHGLRASRLPDDDRIHMLIPHHRQVQARGFTVIERTRRMPNPVLHGNIKIAPLVRATTDAARRIRTTEPVAKLLIEAIQKGRCSATALADELETGQRRGTAIPRRVLAEAEHLRSIAEFTARTIANRLEVPPSHWNVPLLGPAGYVGTPDGWWDEVCMAMEVDSVEYHFYEQDYKDTVRRNARYRAAGILVVQVLPYDLLHNPDRVLAELEATYRQAVARPRPEIIIGRDAA